MSIEPSREREEFIRWISKLKTRAPILPPPATSFSGDDGSTNNANGGKKTPMERAREELRACGATVRVERVRGVALDSEDAETPSQSDEVLYHVSVTNGTKELYSSRTSGVPRRCVLQDEHCDVTRALELALRNMSVGDRWKVRADWSATYGHAETMAKRKIKIPSENLVRAGDVLEYDVEVLNHVGVQPVRVKESDGSDVDLNAGGRARCTKKTVVAGSGWEMPRPPFEVTIETSAMLVRSSKHVPGTDDEEYMEKKEVSFVVGDGRVPLALDAAVRTMRLNEEALIWSNYGGFGKKITGGSKAYRLMPVLPSDGTETTDGVAYKVKLTAMRHVRDVFDDGTTKKTRLIEGEGQFPVDCPMNDCLVRVHFALSTATAVGTQHILSEKYNTRLDRSLGGKPFEFRLGCGALPEALETSIRLMIPKETSRVVLDLTLGEKARARGYDGENCVKDALGREFGTQPSLATLQWDVVLESFDAAVNWYKADVHEMLDEALVIKEEANALFKTGVYELARAKYEKTLHKLEGVRGLDDKDDYERVQAMKNTLALNLVATLQKLHQHVDALARVNKLIESYPENEKALFRRSVSLLALHEFSAARDDLFACLDLNPALQSTIAKQLDLVKRAEAQTNAKAREQFRFKM